MNKQITTTFTSLPDDVLACIAGFLNVSEKMKLTSLNKQTANALSRPHAWDGTLNFSYVGRENIQKILERMPTRTWFKKIVFPSTFQYSYTSELAMLMPKCLMLQHLNLSGCDMITDDDLQFLVDMRLQHLNLDGFNKITDAGLQHLSGMPLQHLGLSACRITDAGLQHLSGMPLQHLDMWGCQITDAGLQHLSGMPLQHLNLAFCDKITADGLANIAGMPLQYLDLYRCGITRTDLQNFPNLERVANF